MDPRLGYGVGGGGRRDDPFKNKKNKTIILMDDFGHGTCKRSA